MRRQVLEEGEQGLVGPVQVLEDEHRAVRSRPPPRRSAARRRSSPRATPPAPRARRARAGAGGTTPCPGRHGRTASSLASTVSQLVGVADAGVPLDDLGQRPVGDVLAERRAVALSPGGHLGPRVDVGEELADEAALADAGLADEQGELRARLRRSPCRRWPRGRRARPRGRRAASGRRASASTPRRASGAGASHAATGSALPLAATGGSSSYSMTRDVSSWVSAPTATPPGGAAACRRAAVFTASPVRKPRPEAGVDVEAHEGLAGVDADADLERSAVGTGHALEGLDDAQAGAHRALGVVLVHGGHAEDADHGVADELLHGAAVGLDHLWWRGVVLAEQARRRPRGRPPRSSP